MTTLLTVAGAVSASYNDMDAIPDDLADNLLNVEEIKEIADDLLSAQLKRPLPSAVESANESKA